MAKRLSFRSDLDRAESRINLRVVDGKPFGLNIEERSTSHDDEDDPDSQHGRPPHGGSVTENLIGQMLYSRSRR